MLEELAKGKKRLIVLNKAELADLRLFPVRVHRNAMATPPPAPCLTHARAGAATVLPGAGAHVRLLLSN